MLASSNLHPLSFISSLHGPPFVIAFRHDGVYSKLTDNYPELLFRSWVQRR